MHTAGGTRVEVLPLGAPGQTIWEAAAIVDTLDNNHRGLVLVGVNASRICAATMFPDRPTMAG